MWDRKINKARIETDEHLARIFDETESWILYAKIR